MSKSWILVLGALLWVSVACGQEFSRGLSEKDFSAAGLNKLTPAELARLDALIEARLKGQVEQVEEAVTQRMEAEIDKRMDAVVDKRIDEEVKQRVEAEVDKRVEAEVAKKAKSESLLHRMKVVLTPGTEITYETVESTLVGPFKGYDPGTVFTLANGQRWQVVDGSYWSPKSEANKVRKVVIKPGVLGSFHMDIQGAGRAKVKIVSRGPATK